MKIEDCATAQWCVKAHCCVQACLGSAPCGHVIQAHQKIVYSNQITVVDLILATFFCLVSQRKRLDQQRNVFPCDYSALLILCQYMYMHPFKLNVVISEWSPLLSCHMFLFWCQCHILKNSAVLDQILLHVYKLDAKDLKNYHAINQNFFLFSCKHTSHPVFNY